MQVNHLGNYLCGDIDFMAGFGHLHNRTGKWCGVFGNLKTCFSHIFNREISALVLCYTFGLSPLKLVSATYSLDSDKFDEAFLQAAILLVHFSLREAC